MKALACGIMLIGGLCAAVSANAADLRPRPSPSAAPVYVPAPLFDWTGVYVGGFVGGAHALWTIDFDRNDNHGKSEQGADGIAGGVWVGYNYQASPNFVIGVEGEIGTTTAKQTNNIFDNDTSLSAYGPFGSVRARIGYAFDRLLIYGTGGFAFANITNNIQKGENAGEQIVYEDQWRPGYAIGGGIEYAFQRNLSARLDYLYSNFGTVTLTNRDEERADFKNELHLIRIGLTYRF
jgi:outer membrane immunogenic protein